MAIHKGEYYVHPQETWDAAKCKKLANYTAKDGMGNPYHFKGYLGSSASIPSRFGRTTYNGGCVRHDDWYEGEEFHFPVLAEGYEIVAVPTWGWRIKRKEKYANR